MAPSQAFDYFDQIISFTQDWVGQEVWVSIALTDRNFDRHGTSHTQFRFQLEEVSPRLSGARLIFSGTDALLEVSLGQLEEIQQEDSKTLVLREKLYSSPGSKMGLYRKVTLKKG